MTKVIALAVLAGLALAPDASAFGRRSRTTWKSQSCYQETPAGFSYTAHDTIRTAGCTTTACLTVAGTAGGEDALAEVNAQRAARGLPPYLPDPALTAGARAAAAARAARGLFGHTPNDFAYLPPGANARAAGCAAYPDAYGWMSCAVYERATYAGAAWVRGADGRRYMHLFVR